MKPFGALVALTGLAMTSVAWAGGQSILFLLAAITLVAAYATGRASGRSRYIQIIMVYFAIQIMVLSAIIGLDALGLWPASLAGLRVPPTLAMTAGVFCIVCHAATFVPAAQRALKIADRYFHNVAEVRIPIGFGRGFRVKERTLATGAVLLILLLNQAGVYFIVAMTTVASSLQNALQNYDANAFWHVIMVEFPANVTPYIGVTVLQSYIQNVLLLNWRRWMTERYTAAWLDDHTHYHMMLAGSGADNPDQRIAEDVPRFLDAGDTGGIGIFSFSIVLIGTLSALVSFAIILWNLSERLTLPGPIQVPGLLLWCAVAYAVVATIVTSVVGKPLAKLAFERQHYEADFRFGLARLREYSEQVALLSGEQAEKALLAGRFSAIMRNFYRVIAVRTRIMALLSLFNEFSGYIPFIIAVPFYMTRLITLGDLLQVRLSFGAVSSALTVFVNHYQQLADFKSVLDRLTSFDAALEASTGEPATATRTASNSDDFVLSNLTVALPGGVPLLRGLDLRLAGNENVLLTGPSGSGKSTLLRALSGVWPHVRGQVGLPYDARTMVLPQKPYLPIGTLLAAVSYPELAGTYEPEDVRAALVDVGLAKFVDELDVEDNWGQRLSGGEQQRLAVARALLVEPDWLFLDEATAAMDPDLERRIYETLARRLPGTTLVSIAHRETLAEHHARRLDMRPTSAGLFEPGAHRVAAE